MVIPNSIDASELKEQTQGDYVAYSGRISREKGVDMIIEAARRHPDIPFRFAGAVRDADLVEDLPANVTLMDHLSGKDLENFYRNARFFVMASRWYEGFPMTILEAARYGKPMIAPDHGGFTEIIGHGDAAIGILVTPNDPSSLESAISSLWSSTSRSCILGIAAYNKLKSEYSTEVISQKWNALLKSIISQ